VTVSEWLKTHADRQYHPPSKITSGDLEAFLAAVRIFPGSYERKLDKHGRVQGLRERDMSQDWEYFLAMRNPPTARWPYHTPRIDPTPVTVSQWLKTQANRQYRSPSEITSGDLKDFLEAANLCPGSYEMKRDKNKKVQGLRERDMSQDWEYFLAMRYPPTVDWPYHTPGTDPTHVTVSQWLKTQANRQHHHPSEITSGDLKDFLEAANLCPGSYELSWDKNRVAGLRASYMSNWEYFLAMRNPPTAEFPYHTPGIEPSHVLVSQWLKTQENREHHQPSEIRAYDLKDFLKAANLCPGSYELKRDKDKNKVTGLRAVNVGPLALDMSQGFGPAPVSGLVQPIQAQTAPAARVASLFCQPPTGGPSTNPPPASTPAQTANMPQQSASLAHRG